MNVAGPGGGTEALEAGGKGAVDGPETGIWKTLGERLALGVIPVVVEGKGEFAFIVPPAVDALIEERGEMVGVVIFDVGIGEVEDAGVDVFIDLAGRGREDPAFGAGHGEG